MLKIPGKSLVLGCTFLTLFNQSLHAKQSDELRRVESSSNNSAPKMLVLNHLANSSFSEALAKNFDLSSSLRVLSDDEKQIETLIDQHQIIYLNAQALSSDNPLIDDYLAQAQQKQKTLLLENTKFLYPEQLQALPFVAQADALIIKPFAHDGRDHINIYGGEALNAEKMQAQSANRFGFKFGFDDSGDALESTDKFFLADQSSEMSDTTIDSIITKLKSGKESSDNLLGTELLSTGGSIGYECPSQARSERLCYAAIITNNPYSHQDGDADINILNHYSFVMYRTDQATAVAVSLFGSANPNMKKTGDTHKAFYLESVDTTIDVSQNGGLTLVRRLPQNRTDRLAITSSSGISFGIDASASDKPSLGASFSYDESLSVRMDIDDWATTTTTADGIDASWSYRINYPRSINDWVVQKGFKKARFRSVPSISANGLQYTAEAVWVGDSARRDYFQWSSKAVVNNRQIWFTKRTAFKWSASRNGWIHTLTSSGRWLNLNWLKHL